ncbi:MAG: DUF3373 family protein, partial [Desulfuromonadaceae bacterium]
MKLEMVKKLLCIAVAGMIFPLAAQATEADLQLKVDKLTKEVNDLKGSVKKVEDKSLGKWLTIGGEYRFRVDSLRGETVPYSDAIGTMQKMVGGMVNGYSYVNPMTYAIVTVPAVAGLTIGNNETIANPSGTAFIFQGKAGSLFTPEQFTTILTQYMPSAMYNGFTTQIMPALATMTPAMVTGYLQTNALTAQQNAILSTLTNKGLMNKVMSMMPQAYQDAFAGMPQAYQQAAMVMAIQGFLGDPASNPSSFLTKVPAYKPKNETLYTNKFGLNLTAKPIQDITVHASLGMYKAFGSQTETPTVGNYYADRVGAFDGTIGHIPSDSKLNVDRAYATWANIADEPIWFSVGRRPSTNGVPAHLRLNKPSPGSTGTPAILVDYAFDGVVLGYAPDIDMLPGASAKVCYGRGFESGFQTMDNSVKDTDMLGVSVVPIDTDPLRVWLQWNRGFKIFDFPVMENTVFGNTAPATNLGDIDWYGAGAMSTLKKVGPGSLNMFADFGLSVTHPNGNVSDNAGFQGLMSGEFFAQDFAPKDQTGWAVYTGIRYDLPSKTKLGFEFNHGSKYWITFAPSADDMWTSKVGTRGNVYEPYIIQEL